MLTRFLSPILLHSEPGVASGSTPPAAPPSEPSTPSGDNTDPPADFDFASLTSPDNEDDPADVVTPEPAPATTPPPDPQAPVAAQPAPAATVPPAAPAQPAAPTPAPAPAQATQPQPQPAQPAQPAQPTAAEPQPVTAQAVEAAYSQYEKNILPQLEATYKGAMTPELAKELDENPASAIPKLMAKVHYNSHIAAYTGIMSQLPTIVMNVLQRQKLIDQAEGSFYGRWPALKDAKYGTVVDQGLRAYRAANPTATQADLIEKAGLMIMISQGLNPNPQPTAPALPGNGAPPPPPPPAGRGGSGPPRQAAAGVDIWSELVSDEE